MGALGLTGVTPGKAGVTPGKRGGIVDATFCAPEFLPDVTRIYRLGVTGAGIWKNVNLS